MMRNKIGKFKFLLKFSENIYIESHEVPLGSIENIVKIHLFNLRKPTGSVRS